MARKSKFWKDQKKVRKYLKSFNKSLKEDCFAGRFELKQIGRKDYQTGAWTNFNRDFITIENWDDPCWRYSKYLIQFIDNEEPERNVSYWCGWSDTFTLIELTPLDFDGDRYLRNQGLSSVAWTLNNFIIESDFWEKWRSYDYKKTHWYSGEELKKMVQYGGERMSSPEAFQKYKDGCYKDE